MIDKDKCTGCGACRAICPKEAISLKEEIGGLKPKVDESLCIQCNKCDEVCPPLHLDKLQTNDMKEAFLFVNNNSFDRGCSSSGGFFKAVSDHVFAKGGVVYGASFANDYSVNHIRIDNPDDVYSLMESKYVQSDTVDTYKEAENDLNGGRLVLYSGTPCQIAGFKSYLNKDFDNLILLEVFCHGVPAGHIWQSYLNDYHGHEEVIRYIHFRYKRKGWWESEFKVQYGHDEYAENYRNTKDPYMFAFLNNYDINPSCYECPFRTKRRCSDFYIGDAWNINKIKKNMDDDRGVSMVVLNTEKAINIMTEISKGNKCFQVSIEDCVYTIVDLYMDKNKPEIYDDFQRQVVENGFRKAFWLIAD